MFWELWQTWRTPTHLPYVRPMGYLHESIAMRARAKRCESSWQTHYQYCRNTILSALDGAAQSESIEDKAVLIFGAGHLADIPLKALSRRCAEVILVDLLFSGEARRRAAAYSNVVLVEHDVSENLAAIYARQATLAEHLMPAVKWLHCEQIGLVISLNLITQLPLLAAKYLLKKHRLSLSQADAFANKMIQLHLDYLRAFDCPVCLLADREVLELDRCGQVLDAFSPWWQVAAPPSQKEWLWELAPFGEIARHRRQVHRVGVSGFRGNQEWVLDELQQTEDNRITQPLA